MSPDFTGAQLEALDNRYVSRREHATVVRNLENDIAEIKGDMKWAMRGIVMLLLTTVIQVVILLASRGFA